MQKKESWFSAIGAFILFILKLPLYVWQAIPKKKIDLKKTILKSFKKKEETKPAYVPFEIIETNTGDYQKFEEKIFTSDSKIGIILGARGSGKSALGMKFLENAHAKTQRKCCAIGFKQEDLPDWIVDIENVQEIINDSFVLIDEGGILFSSRESMSEPNKLLSDLILVARHKNLSILFISQNSSNLDVNILRQADYLLMKQSSLLQIDFERKKIKDIYLEVDGSFKKHAEIKGLTYVYSDQFRGFVTNNLPTFWSTGISKSFR
ncbi:MAG: hypothetical protein HGA85_07665 [Nanoarchaeota archaeon]|nr:hypothetical protein [Nanoarchaeota archaeon]